MSLEGKEVEYSVGNGDTGLSTMTGLVLDKIYMKEKDNSPFATTGYLVLNLGDSKVYPIAYWRVKGLVLTKSLAEKK